MKRSRAMIIAAVSIGCFLLLFSYAVVQFMMVDRVLRYNVGENMLWAVTQANRETQRLMLAIERGDDAAEQTLRFDILYSRVALLIEKPQWDYFAMLGLSEPLARAMDLTRSIEAGMAGGQGVGADLGALDSILRDVSNETVLAERRVRGAQHDQQRGAMRILLLAVLGAFLSGTFMAGQLLRTVQRSARVQQELEHHRAVLEETVAQRTRELEIALVTERRAKEVYRSFIVTVPHQFRTPLSIINMVAQRQLRGVPEQDPARLQTKFRRIFDSATRLERLLSGIMSIVTMDAQELNRQRIDFNDVARAALDEMREAHPDRVIAVDLAAAPLFILGDSVLLAQVVLNLLGNAAKYSAADSVIRLRSSREGEAATLSVADTGMGIPEAAHAMLFERFYRAPNALHLPGMGVGLSLSRDIVSLHDGEIGFRSEEGKGATFTITLPMLEEAT